MMENYLVERANLRGVVLILDVRRTPVAEDAQMLDWLRAYSVSPILVVTKCDKVSRNEKAKQARIIAQTLGVSIEELNFFSALNKEGKELIWTRIEELLMLPSVA